MPDAALRTALVVAVPEAALVVDAWRERTCYAKPSVGVPAHVTVLFPFVPAARVTEQLLVDLHGLFGTFPTFAVTFAETARFESVLYLAPLPAEPFVRLTEAVARAYPEYPPYDGEFDEVVPHLTVAEGDPVTLGEAEADMRPALPITAYVAEVVLLEELELDAARWRVRATLPLHVPASDTA